MKYTTKFKNPHGDEFSVDSMEDYVVSDKDIESFSRVLDDAPVQKYITDDAMVRWDHATVTSLTKDILSNSSLRWTENAERRFIIRDSGGNAVGMIGVTLENVNKSRGELWYYKISSAPSLMYEALVCAIEFLKQDGIKNLLATFELDNVRTIHILEKLDFHHTDRHGEMAITLE